MRVFFLSGLASALSQAPLRKAESAPSGSRWITVHPNGSDEKGVPVLIQETAHGSGVYHVIGGAGGKLNYLKLRGVKSPEHYAAEVRDKQAAKREQKKVQAQRDRENGVAESKKAQRDAVRGEVAKREAKFVSTVADAMGWKPEEMQLPPEKLEGLSEAAKKKAEETHHRALVTRARAAADLQMKSLALKAEASLAGDLNEPAEDPVPDASGPGYSPDYTGRTAEQAADIKAESSSIDESRRTPERQASADTAKERAKSIRDELAKVNAGDVDLKAKVLDTKNAIALARAHKELQTVHKQARAANAAIERGEEKAFVLEVGSAEGLDEKVRQQVLNDLRTSKTRAFLSEFAGKVGDPQSVGRHLAVGAYNALNTVALTAAGVSGLDRDAVDVLGVAGAAQALAARLRADLPPAEYENVVKAMEAYHVNHYMQRAEDALRESAELEESIKEMALPAAHDGDDLARAHLLNQRRKEVIGETSRMLGQALGEFEANAALLVALKSKSVTPARVPMGALRTEDAVRRLRAIGLERGDYQIEHAGPEVIATVTPDGLKRMVKPADAQHLRDVRDALDIIEGRQDDPHFWPGGMARRPDLALPPAPAGSSAALAKPFSPGADLAQSIRDYIGGRMADGHAIEDVVRDLQSDDLARMAGDRRGDYFKALDAVVPLSDADGKPIEAEHRRGQFESMADDFVGREYGGNFSPIHAQRFAINDKAADALHRAFASEPTGPLAFKATGDLGPSDQGALRAYFDKHLAANDADVQALKTELGAHEAAEPEREVEDMFGRGTNPAWLEWKERGDALKQQVGERGLDWGKYTTIMGGTAAAYRAVQDHLRGRVVSKFHEAHARLDPDNALKLGRTVLSNHLRHLDAVDPAARESRLSAHRELVDNLRDRVAGRYASGGVADKIDETRQRQAAFEQAQLGMFAAAPEEAAAERPLASDERPTLGVAAESQLAQMAESIGANFKPGQTVKIGTPTMTGKFVPQQRAIKLIERNKRLALAQGVGSGKTNMGLGAFAHLHTSGKAKRGLFVVPSIVQGQFHEAALSFLEPGRFKWHAEPGASRESRLAAYRDPKTHFSVVTHQAFRDDMIHLAAQQAGAPDKEIVAKVAGMTGDQRRDWAKQTMAAAGMDHDFLMVDEGHDLLNRAGKQDSTMANVVDSVAHNTPYYVNATADPIKNDPSEAFDLLHKMNPTRYSDRSAFMRRYGVDTIASRDQLRREMAAHFYPGRIDPGIQVRAREEPVTLTDAQTEALKQVESTISKLRLSRLSGKVDVDAARQLSPDSFAGIPADQHEAVAKRLASSAGILRETAVAKIIDAHEKGGKLDAVSRLAHARRGKPGVVFARSRAAVQQITDRLKAEGHRIITITGADSAAEKAAKRRKFRPESGEAEGDILVCSDAGAVGLNAQRGAWLVQNDTPLTAKTHAQRNGRINRLGQLNPNIELLDLVANHPHEQDARRRLKQKYGLREVMTSPLEGMDDTGFAAYLSRAANAENDQRKAA